MVTGSSQWGVQVVVVRLLVVGGRLRVAERHLGAHQRRRRRR